MAEQFNIVAQMVLQGPANIRAIRQQLQSQLQGINAEVNVSLAKNTNRSLGTATKRLDNMAKALTVVQKNATGARQALQQLTTSVNNIGNNLKNVNSQASKTAKSNKQVTTSTQEASNAMEEFGRASALATKRFVAFSVGAGIFVSLVTSIKSGIREAVSFQREMIKVAQVSGQLLGTLGTLDSTITRLATTLGVSSGGLIEVSRILTQTGLTAKETEIALSALAKTELAPTFVDIKKTAEGAIAAMRQFDLGAGQLEAKLGSINALAGNFAVESDDLIFAIRRAGGAFKAAGGSLEELLALFTSVRGTTRESAQTIATGFRTIFTRLQRPQTLQFLEELGIQLRNAENQFVGPYEAIRRLNQALSQMESRDPRFARIVEEIGGFRQVSKVIPLIQQFGDAERALQVAIGGTTSLSRDAKTAQQALAVQLQKVREEFLALFRDISRTETFKGLAEGALSLASALIDIADGMKPLLPLLATLGGLKLGAAGLAFGKGFFGHFAGMSAPAAAAATTGVDTQQAQTQKRVQSLTSNTQALEKNSLELRSLATTMQTMLKARYNLPFPRGAASPLRRAGGGFVPGKGNRDTVPALLTPGEFVIKKSAAESLGAGALQSLNAKKFATGGRVPSKFGLISLFPTDKQPVQDTARFGIGEIQKKLTGTGFRPDLASNNQTDNNRLIREALKIGSSNTINTGILGESFRDKSLAEDISKNISRSINDLAIETGKRLAGKMGVSASGQNVQGLISKNALDATTGNVFEGALASLGEPFDSRGAGREAIDFPGGLGPRFKKSFPGLVGAPTDAKRTLDGQKISDLKNIKIPNFLAGIAAKYIPKVSNKQASLGLGQALVAKKGAAFTAADLGGKVSDLSKNQTVRDNFDIVRRGGTTRFIKKAMGGPISGKDSVPALLTPGEFVINKSAASALGTSTLKQLNNFKGYNKGGPVQKFQSGGVVTGGGGGNIGGLILSLAFGLSALSANVTETNSTFRLLTDGLLQAVVTFQLIQSAGRLMVDGITNAVNGLKSLTTSSTRAAAADNAEAAASSNATTASGKFGGAINAAAAVGAVLTTVLSQVSGYYRQRANTLAESAKTQEDLNRVRENASKSAFWQPFGTGFLSGEIETNDPSLRTARQSRFSFLTEGLTEQSRLAGQGRATTQEVAAAFGDFRTAIREAFLSDDDAQRASQLRQARGQLPQLRDLADSIAANVSSLDEFESALGDTGFRLISTISLLTGQDPERVGRQIESQIQARIQAEESLRKFREAILNATEVEKDIKDFADVIRNATGVAANLNASLGVISGGGATFRGPVAGFENIFGRAAEGANLPAGALEKATDFLVTPFGDIGKRIKGEALNLADATRRLPEIVAEAERQTRAGIADDLGSALRAQLEKAGFSDKINEGIETALSRLEGSGEGEAGVLKQISGSLEEFSAGLLETVPDILNELDALAKETISLNNSLIQAYQTRSQIENKIVDANLNVERVRIRGARTLAQGRGGLQDRLRPADFRDSLNRQLGTLGVGGLGASQIGDRLEDVLEERVRLEKEIQEATDIETRLDLIREFQTLQDESSRLNKALELLANSSEELSSIQNELGRLQQNREKKFNLILDTFAAPIDQQREFARNVAAVGRAGVGGMGVRGIGRNQLSGVIGIARQFADESLAIFGRRNGADRARTGTEFLEDLVRDLVPAGPLRQILERQILNRPQDEKTLLQRISEITQRQLEAAEEQARVLRDQRASITTAIQNQTTQIVGILGEINGKLGGDGAPPQRKATGGLIQGLGSGDKVPAMLEPGEFVLNRNAVNAVGLSKLKHWNSRYPRKRTGMISGGEVLDALSPYEWMKFFQKSVFSRTDRSSPFEMNKPLPELPKVPRLKGNAPSLDPEVRRRIDSTGVAPSVDDFYKKLDPMNAPFTKPNLPPVPPLPSSASIAKVTPTTRNPLPAHGNSADIGPQISGFKGRTPEQAMADMMANARAKGAVLKKRSPEQALDDMMGGATPAQRTPEQALEDMQREYRKKKAAMGEVTPSSMSSSEAMDIRRRNRGTSGRDQILAARREKYEAGKAERRTQYEEGKRRKREEYEQRHIPIVPTGSMGGSRLPDSAEDARRQGTGANNQTQLTNQQENTSNTMGSFAQQMETFSGLVDKFSAAISAMPTEIQLQANHKVEVVINGATVLTELEPTIRKIAIESTNKALSNFRENLSDGRSPQEA